jgi:hypothetical protein
MFLCPSNPTAFRFQGNHPESSVFCHSHPDIFGFYHKLFAIEALKVSKD